MLIQLFKTTLAIMIFSLVTVLPVSAAVTIDTCSELTTFCKGAGSDLDNPSILSIFCPFSRVFNLLLLFVGVVLVIFIVYGALKMSLALGDPKGLEAAHSLWTWLFVGTGVVLGFYFIFFAVANLVGLSLGTGLISPSCIMDQLFLRFRGLLEGAHILRVPTP